MKQKYRSGIDMADKYAWLTEFAGRGLLLLTLVVLGTMSAASAATGTHPAGMEPPSNAEGEAACIACHVSNNAQLSDGSGPVTCSSCHADPFPAVTPTPTATVTPAPTPVAGPTLILALNTTMDAGNALVDNITNAVLLDTAGITRVNATLPDNVTALFNLTGINPGDYFIEVNDLAGDRVPTRIDSNESDINQFVGERLRNSIIGNISDPMYRIKARPGGRHPIVNYFTGANESEVPFIIVSMNPEKIQIHEINTSRELTNFTPSGAHPTGDSFQTWILGSDNHGINYNDTDSKCNTCHGNLSNKASIFSAITTSNGFCYRCHYGKSGDGNGFVDPIQPVEDTMPPVTTTNVIENATYNNSVTVNLDATDNGSGVNETFYMVNGGPTTTYSVPFVVDTVGPDNLTYWSTDNAGNVENPNMVNFTIEEITQVNATAMRSIENKSMLPGESTTITVNIDRNSNALALHEIPPEGWSVTRGTDNADNFKNSTIEWVWIGTDENKTVTYTLTAPMNISVGTYQIEGTISDANGILTNVEGDNTIKIDILEFYRRLGNDPEVVETMDLLKAFDDFRNNVAPLGFDRPLSAEEVNELIDEWKNS